MADKDHFDWTAKQWAYYRAEITRRKIEDEWKREREALKKK